MIVTQQQPCSKFAHINPSLQYTRLYIGESKNAKIQIHTACTHQEPTNQPLIYYLFCCLRFENQSSKKTTKTQRHLGFRHNEHFPIPWRPGSPSLDILLVREDPETQELRWLVWLFNERVKRPLACSKAGKHSVNNGKGTYFASDVFSSNSFPTGISLRSQELFAIVFACRYLDIFWNFASLYNWLMKIIYLVTSFSIVYFMRISKLVQSL